MGSRRRGRSRYSEGQFWALPYSLAHHPAFRALSAAAVKVFIELHTRFTVRGDGSTNNNGELALSLDEAARLLAIGKSTAKRALAELEVAGFIVKTRQGQWYGRRASQYRLTDTKHRGEPPTRDWERIWKESNSALGPSSAHTSPPTVPPRNRTSPPCAASKPVSSSTPVATVPRKNRM